MIITALRIKNAIEKQYPEMYREAVKEYEEIYMKDF